MSRERISLLDTTLRDGAQTTGVDFSLDDKKQIAHLLDALGIDYVEGGYPGANPLDTEFFKVKRTKAAHFAAFGMTIRASPLCSIARPTPSSMSPKPGIIRCAWRSAARWRKISKA